ncbi:MULTISPECIES: DUF493 family protein [Flavobacteriaceae]|uniref:DUF493 family protein n=1 Tax=Flavobacteriaceae TaxID=49546 RepID=UPI0010AE689D|nr:MULTISPECIES: DUF493 family protein [Flavobacteriaceae]NJB35441.1 DUF493 family protein [Croceivirga sp. JEA036]TKD66254.1 DUF493 family protein [Flavobacterium sp. ASW18X]
MDQKKSEEFYNRLREQLWDNTSWPSKYLYKFIVPSNSDGVTQINTIFDNMGAVIGSKTSSKGTYTSLSITVQMKDPDAVIAKYKEVEGVKGVISL